MERLYHYTWQHRLFLRYPLQTVGRGETVEVIDVGLYNTDAGPDFFNAKIKIDGVLFVGNVEIHECASQWNEHGHQNDDAYENVILHVCGKVDTEIFTKSHRSIPQIEISVPEEVTENYEKLLANPNYPPCYQIIPELSPLLVRNWMSVLGVERLQYKTHRVETLLKESGNDWERTFFVLLSRAFGFGINSDAFEQWARGVPLMMVGKHRDNIRQVEAFFFGQAGMLQDEAVAPAQRDEYFLTLQREYAFLSHKFSLFPMPFSRWRMLRLRPQNFPQIRLSQLVRLYHRNSLNFSSIIEQTDLNALRNMFKVGVTEYWETHYSFGKPHLRATSLKPGGEAKQLSESSVNRLLINAVVPILFAYGRVYDREDICQRVIDLLEMLPAEKDHISRTWQEVGLPVSCAADSQSLLHLKTFYCDRKDCLRCRFGKEYITRSPRIHLFREPHDV